mmetsp:Transcript_6345/g.20638  ORF Transcript_6345/g.20638 Transcript_6345/m.20638 type:complete len:208 (+) Transcript_6345:677-1300(+)
MTPRPFATPFRFARARQFPTRGRCSSGRRLPSAPPSAWATTRGPPTGLLPCPPGLPPLCAPSSFSPKRRRPWLPWQTRRASPSLATRLQRVLTSAASTSSAPTRPAAVPADRLPSRGTTWRAPSFTMHRPRTTLLTCSPRTGGTPPHATPTVPARGARRPTRGPRLLPPSTSLPSWRARPASSSATLSTIRGAAAAFATARKSDSCS